MLFKEAALPCGWEKWGKIVLTGGRDTVGVTTATEVGAIGMLVLWVAVEAFSRRGAF